MMTVDKLIEQLQELPGHYRIVAQVHDGEWPFLAEITTTAQATGYAVVSVTA